MKKKEIVMFICIGAIWIVIFSVLGTVIGRNISDRYKRTEKETVEEKDREKVLEKEREWNLILVNRDHPLPEDYNIPTVTDLKNGQAVDSRIYPELQAMMDAARAEGLEPLICSSYRGWDRQQELYIRKVRSYVSSGHSWETALELAQSWVQRASDGDGS